MDTKTAYLPTSYKVNEPNGQIIVEVIPEVTYHVTHFWVDQSTGETQCRDTCHKNKFLLPLEEKGIFYFVACDKFGSIFSSIPVHKVRANKIHTALEKLNYVVNYRRFPV